ncbi:hypothetical protein OG765_00735 [Streptomyces sp. NBC_00555]|uniref:hypothetical protein n=1 Tax=Streptomyces sp. NBC_00555 TaxID=2903662 RepID=UPI00224E6E2B|nr:hypothetical protein [Streptomyces sp. NBC_00555]MCX5009530.1 hypothetical protein [Streptomyces sp. NBC_00555]
MPSVMGLIEEREVAARQRVELLRNELDRLVAELEEAEAARDRLVIAKETVSEVLSEAGEPKDVRVPMPGRLSRNRRWSGRCPARWCRCGGKGWT